MIVQELYRLQHQNHGYLPKDELRALARRIHTPLHRLHEVASFFPHFRLEPPPAVEAIVCRDMACHLAGSSQVLDRLRQFKSERGLDDQQLSVTGVSCLGRCDRAPAACVVSRRAGQTRGPTESTSLYVKRSPDALARILEQTFQGKPPPPDTDAAWIAGAPPPWKIDAYAADASLRPYEAVRRFLASSDSDAEAERIIGALQTAGLLGMGGAGGRAFKKWSEVRQARGERKFVVCNADESEPGTFKDRELLLRTPHLVLEGVLLGGLVVGAERGYIYVRHEYHEQIEALEREIQRAEDLGLCGRDILGSGVDLPVEVFVSPGGYICGEQTALIEVIEDRRAEPRNRPPELQTNGLWNMPTLLNNVETLAWVPAIILRDEGRWFAEQGARRYKGMRFFAISGHVRRPGVYEVPIGITLGELIRDYAGGMVEERELKAVALSGPSGGFLPAKLPVDRLPREFVEANLAPDAKTFDLAELELDIELSRKLNLMLGAGIVVYAEGTDMLDQAQNCVEFFRNESCGKCVPCRLGSQKFVEMATELRAGKLPQESVASMGDTAAELAETMQLTAICGLGTVAANPLLSLLEYFPADVKRGTRSAGPTAG